MGRGYIVFTLLAFAAVIGIGAGLYAYNNFKDTAGTHWTEEVFVRQVPGDAPDEPSVFVARFVGRLPEDAPSGEDIALAFRALTNSSTVSAVGERMVVVNYPSSDSQVAVDGAISTRNTLKRMLSDWGY